MSWKLRTIAGEALAVTAGTFLHIAEEMMEATREDATVMATSIRTVRPTGEARLVPIRQRGVLVTANNNRHLLA